MSLILGPADWGRAAERLNVEERDIKTVAKVEGAKEGFLPSGRPKVLFEGHYFHKLTGGRFSKSHPTISYPKWTKRFYVGGEREWIRLNKAIALDREAALKSASWGQFQIMGANYEKAGFESVEAFVTAMHESASAHIDAFCFFLEYDGGLIPALQAHDWRYFARVYNGPGQVDLYERLLKKAYASFL